MRKKLFLLLLLLISVVVLGGEERVINGKPAYPIIFVHGLNGNDGSFETTNILLHL